MRPKAPKDESEGESDDESNGKSGDKSDES